MLRLTRNTYQHGWIETRPSKELDFEVFAIGLKRRNKVGGADGIRTHDLLDAIEARSQLRHGPTGDNLRAYHTPMETLAALCIAPL